MKFIEVTEYVSDQSLLINVSRIDLVTQIDDCTIIRIGDEEIVVNENPATIVGKIERASGRMLND